MSWGRFHTECKFVFVHPSVHLASVNFIGTKHNQGNTDELRGSPGYTWKNVIRIYSDLLKANYPLIPRKRMEPSS